ncbi:MAG: hypothetical protein ABDH66_00710 [Bacteroidia bacterium]
MEGVIGLAIVFVVVGIPVLGGLALAAYNRYLKHKEKVPISPDKLRQIEKTL